MESTNGNVEVNKPVEASESIGIFSEGSALIHADLKGREVAVSAKLGVAVQAVSTEVHSKFGERNILSWMMPNVTTRVNPFHNPFFLFPLQTPAPAPSTVSITAEKVSFQSGKEISFKGVHLTSHDLTLMAKEGILFDVNHPKSTDPLGIFKQNCARTQLTTEQAYLQANDLLNNGQTMTGKQIWLKLENDLVNQNAGKIAATDFLSIEAKNINNLCKVQTVEGEYDTHDVYSPSFLSGGDGHSTDGIGLYLHASGKLINDASTIETSGTNLIQADQGIDIKARSNRYLSEKKEEKHLLGLNRHHEEVRETLIGRSSIVSQQGQNILISQTGNLKSVATDFTAHKGTFISTHRNAEFYDLIASTEVTKEDRTLGIFYDKENRDDEYASPTIIQDLNGITVVSDADIKLRGTVVLTPGHLEMDAQKIEYTVSTLKHQYKASSFGLAATLANQELLSTHNPCDFSRPFWCGDSTAGHLNQLANSHGLTETLLNSWSTGVDVANTANAFINGCRTNTLPQEILKRELPSLYAPQFGINFTKTKTEVQTESLGKGAIYAGSANFKARDTLKIKDCPIQVLGNAEMNAPKILIEGAKLNSEVHQRTQNLNFTLSAKGDPYQVGLSSSHYTCSSTQAINTSIGVAGQLTLDAKQATLDGAEIKAKKITGEVGTLTIITETDTSETECESYSVSTGGNFCLSKQSSRSQTVNQASGIHVKDSIEGDTFTVNHLNTLGGQITSENEINFKADTIQSKAVEEYQEVDGFSVNGNFKDFRQDIQVNHLLPITQQSALMTTTNLGFNNSCYQAETQSVIYGQQGTHIESKTSRGDMVTNSSEGRKIIENKSHNYQVVIPHMTEETKAQFKENLSWAERKVIELGQSIQKSTTQFFQSPKKSEADPQERSIYHPGKSAPQKSHLHKKGKIAEETKVQENDDVSPIADEGNHPITKESGKAAVSQEEQKEAYLEGKMAAATDDFTCLEGYSESERAKFYIGYYEVKGTQNGMLLTPLLTLGGIALPIIAEFAGNILSLGVNTWGLFKKINNLSTNKNPHILKIGDKVYRVWGDGAGPYGRSWTRTDPSTLDNYRDLAGLPDQNSGRFVSEGLLIDLKEVDQRSALSLHGNSGGLDELLVPKPFDQIELQRVSGVNLKF